MTPRRRSAALSALSAAIALLVPAALAQALPVMTTSTSGSMFTIDITGAGANKAVWFLQLPAGIDRTVLPNIFDTAAAGAQVISTGRTSATGSFHASFPVTVCPVDVEYAGYTQFAGIRFLGTMVPNPSASSVLEPGVGFTGPTPEPGQIGTGTAKAIARWDVVPYQTIQEATDPMFNVGVVAFHIAGIEKVSFSLEGGPWVDARQMTLNPQTGVWEYCATIDARDFNTDRPIELRAIAYPKAAAPQAQGTGAYPGGGYPRLLESLRLYVDADAVAAPNAKYCSPIGSDAFGDGSVGNPYKSIWKAAQAVHAAGGSSHANGGTVYLDAGDYTWDRPGGGTIPVTTDRWLMITPKPGISRDEVHFRAPGWWPGLGIGKIHLKEVTLNDFLSASSGPDALWLDHVTCVGRGMGLQTSSWAGWVSGFIDYWTDVEVFDCESSLPASSELARNCYSERVTGGVGDPKLLVNCTWNGTDYGPSTGHADLIAWNYLGQDTTVDNRIVYGVKGIGVHAQGIFFKTTGYLHNVAIVNTLINLLSQQTEIGQDCRGIDHLLLHNVTHDGIFYWEMPQSAMNNMSIRGCEFRFMACPPPGNSVSDGWFDNCHYVQTGGSGNAITPGTNVTTGDPMWQPGGFVPAPNSPLRNRLSPLLVPIDAAGTLRPTPGTVGAFE